VKQSIAVKMNELKSKLDRTKGQIDEQQTSLDTIINELDYVTKQKEIIRQSVLLIEKASETVRYKIKEQIEPIVTSAIKSIFGADYKFEMNFQDSRNNIITNMLVSSKRYPEAVEPMDTHGGGLIDLLSFCLRAALLNLYEHDVSGPIIADEPLKHLSPEQIDSASEMIRFISQKTGRQIIYVTHSASLGSAADNLIKL